MSSFDFAAEGLPQLEGDLRGLSDDLDDLPMDGIAGQAVQLLRRFTPKASGRLARSTRPVDDRTGHTVGATQGGGPIQYAGPINYGWRRHHIRPARQLQRTEERLEAIAEQLLEAGIDDAIERRGLT